MLSNIQYNSEDAILDRLLEGEHIEINGYVFYILIDVFRQQKLCRCQIDTNKTQTSYHIEKALSQWLKT